ncbi:MAG: outer membrane protein assembly factor BamB [Gammaproteobacteria bacterium]|nr:outer membrane protein assembly factor BamB [Gammaproteobacteria bacterium]
MKSHHLLKLYWNLFSVVFALFLASCSSTPSEGYYFPEEQHPEKAAPLVSFKPEIQILQLWSAKVTDVVPREYLRLNPAISGHLIFVPTYDGYVKAFDQQTGHLVWQKNLGIQLSTGVCAAYDKVFVATDNGGVIALNQSDGKILWKRSSVASEILATPTVGNQMVFVKSIDGSLTAFSQSSGQQLWRYEQPVPSLFLHVSSSPIVYGHYVISGFANGHLVALRSNTGEVIWDKLIAPRSADFDRVQIDDIDITPVMRNRTIFVGGYQGKIMALDLKTGHLIWRHQISMYSGIASDDDHLYIADAKSYVWAFTQDVGALSWRQKYLYYRQISAPALIGPYLVVGDASSYLHWMFKKDGHFVARNHLDGSAILTTPLVSHGAVFVYTRSGIVYKLRIKN